ncbi:MAG: hypothetical protein ACR2PS_17925 [Pseudomonadales bacterium]
MNLSTDLSRRAERQIAQQFMGRLQWEMIAIGLGQSVVWLANWYLVLHDVYPMWVAFVIATVCATVAYLPSHEGQHGNLSRKKEIPILAPSFPNESEGPL